MKLAASPGFAPGPPVSESETLPREDFATEQARETHLTGKRQ
jgi:hypothetical protein